MKTPFALLITSLIFTINCLAQKAPNEFVNEIELENIKQHVYTLASPEMQGRNTGEQGQKDAAAYISNYFRQNGLDSLGLNSYYQTFNLYSFNMGEAKLGYPNHSDFNPDWKKLKFWGPTFSNGNINIKDTLQPYFAGFGKNLPETDLSNKVVFVLLDKNLGQTHENIRSIAKNTGAKLFVVLFKEQGIWRFNHEKDKVDEIVKHGALSALGYAIKGASLNEGFNKRIEKKELLNASVNIETPVYICYTGGYTSRFVFNEKKIKTVYKHEEKRLKGKNIEPFPLAFDSVFVNVNSKTATIDTLFTENVVAFIEGSDKKDEVIVVTGHYDHVGVKRDTIIRYGADDNASGTVAVMEVAKAMQKAVDAGNKPKRSVAFVAFSAEEKGLHGSHYYVQNAPTPITSTVLNFNLDMVGRNKDDLEKFNKHAFVISNGKGSKYFKRTTKKLNKKNPSLNVSTHPGLKERMTWKFSSDHFRFSRLEIPIMCFFTGLHPDYHTERDTPDKINYEKLTEITRLTYKTVWELANTSKNLKVEVKIPEKPNMIEKMME